MRVRLLDPSAYTPPYDHALAAALAAAGADVTLVTSRFAHGDVAPAAGYRREEAFYRVQPRGRLRAPAKLAQHVPDLLRERRARPDVRHWQWLPVQPVDARLLPGGAPNVLTAHDVLPREPRPGQRRAQRRLYERVDAVVVHSAHGRDRLTGELGIDPAKVTVIPHGAFAHLTAPAGGPAPLPPHLAAVDPARPVVLMFGLVRPYKGLDVLLEAWRGLGVDEAELWVVGRPRGVALPDPPPPGVRLVPRFVADAELPALFGRASVVVLPYREIEQSGVLATALAFARPLLLTAVGGFPEVAAAGAADLVPPGDPAALRDALRALLTDPARRDRLAAAAARLAAGDLSWTRVAERHLALYARLLAR